MINREQCGQFIDANTDNMVKDWKRLVEIETGSFDKEGLEEAAGTLKAMFEGIGFRCDLCYPQLGVTISFLAGGGTSRNICGFL